MPGIDRPQSQNRTCLPSVSFSLTSAHHTSWNAISTILFSSSNSTSACSGASAPDTQLDCSPWNVSPVPLLTDAVHDQHADFLDRLSLYLIQRHAACPPSRSFSLYDNAGLQRQFRSRALSQ